MRNASLDETQTKELCLENDKNLESCISDEVYDKELVSVPLWYHTMICVILTSLGINGVLLNSLVLRHFWLRKSSQTPYNIILINLSIVELILAFSGISSDIISLLKNGWKFGERLCIISGVLITTSGFVSILTLCLLSVLGYGCILRFPRSSGGDLSFNTISKFIILIWIYALTLSIPPVFGWGRYVPELSGVGCAPDWHTKERSKTYIVWILIFGMFIPTNIIVISSVLTIREIGIPTITLVYNKELSKMIKSRKIDVHLIIAMNLTYLLCWTPYVVIAIIHCFVSKTIIGPMVSIIPVVAVKISVCANPLLYIAYNPKLNKQFETNDFSPEKEDKSSSEFFLPSFKTILKEMQAKHVLMEIQSKDTMCIEAYNG